MKRRLVIVMALAGTLLVSAGCGVQTGGRGYSDSDENGCFMTYSGANRSGVEFCR